MTVTGGTSALLFLTQSLTVACQEAFGHVLSPEECDPQLRVATKPEFGHYQTSLPMRLAKTLKMSPADIAAAVLSSFPPNTVVSPPVFVGGFINFTLTPEYLTALITSMVTGQGKEPEGFSPGRVVVDYSSPNIAKIAHVGHLRSTVIGDCLVSLLTDQGWDVTRQNHVGDWGTQFGLLIQQILDDGVDPLLLTDEDVSVLYRTARARFDTDPIFADAARLRVVLLQAGDEETLTVHHALVEASMKSFGRMYARLGSHLTPDDVAGESMYNTMLPAVVQDLDFLGLLQVSDGAQCVFPEGFAGRDGEPMPLIIQKSDGGYGYAATDLAALRYRVDTLAADMIVYVVDARQALHFDMVFAVARAAGWLPDTVTVQHVAFGTVLGEDGKPFKTRSGETVPLMSLLDDAETAAAELIIQREPDANPAQVARLAQMMGVGAVKYADLSSGLGKDYTFSLERLVKLDGNTGPYLQYAYARVCSLLDKTMTGEIDSLVPVVPFQHPAELRLAFLLNEYAEAKKQAAESLQPHLLCHALYGIAVAFSVFYEQCPMMTAELGVKKSRTVLCQTTQQVLADGLGLLGVEAPPRLFASAIAVN